MKGPRTSNYRVWKGLTERYRCRCGTVVQKRVDAETGKSVVLDFAAPMLGDIVDDRGRKFELYPPTALHWLTCEAKKQKATI